LIAAIYTESVLPRAPHFRQPPMDTVISKEAKAALLFDSLSIHNQLLHQDLNEVLQRVLATREGKVAAIADAFSSVHTNWVWKIQGG
jgi:hypothetical protein